MKKQLLSATALVAAGALATAGAANAQAVKLGVSGYMEQVVGIVFDRDDAPGTTATTAVTSLKQYNESEVHFKGSGKLDNGIEIVADIQLEVAGSPGAIIDEHYAIVRGNFGQVLIGVEDIAPYLMTIGYTGGFATGVGLSHVYDRPNWIRTPTSGGFTRVNGTLTSTELQGPANDPNQISYFSPRFAGFQVGVSYIPTATQQATPTNTTGNGRGTGVIATSVASKTVYNEGWGIGANYVGKFDNVALGIAGGYLTMSPNTGNFDDYRAYNVAASVEVGPFKVAAGWRENLDWDGAGATAAAGTSGEGHGYDIGVRYTFGPNAVNATYIYGEAEGSTTVSGDDEETGLRFAYARTLAPGVALTGNLFYTELEEETGGTDSSTENWAFVTSLRLDF